jgi:hypothetical protein
MQQKGFEAHTGFCLDLGTHGNPITTLGFKILDAYVSPLDKVYFLTQYGNKSELSFVPLSNACSDFGSGFTPDPDAINCQIYHFDHSSRTLPIRILTTDMSMGTRHERKRFRYIEFHGVGIAKIRASVDGRWVVTGTVIATEEPTKARKLAFPRGVNGYTLQLEITGNINFRFIEVSFDPMPSTS